MGSLRVGGVGAAGGAVCVRGVVPLAAPPPLRAQEGGVFLLGSLPLVQVLRGALAAAATAAAASVSLCLSLLASRSSELYPGESKNNAVIIGVMVLIVMTIMITNITITE